MGLKKITTLFLALTLSLLSLLVANPVQAGENFDTDLVTNYNVFANGTTRIQHNFKIRNKKPLFTVSQYALKISSTEINNVVVTEGGKTLEAEVVTTDNQTSIGITFEDKVVGQGKVRDFTISYTSPDAAIVSGQVLEVSVPKLQNLEEYSSYSVVLTTPKKFGLPTRITPDNSKTTATEDSIITTFETLESESVTALFGDNQLFDMTLRYNLENPTSGSKLIQVALPPDTLFQKVFYHSLDPLPQSIETDEDGNWIATYQLPASTTTVVLLTAQAHLTLEPSKNIPSPLPSQELVAPLEFWEYNDESIKRISEQISTARDAYDYVVDNFSYNYDRLGEGIFRFGATEAFINQDQALCQEFTDGFIALARSKNIPARRITGYAYTENSTLRPLSFVEDVLHAWPEYYDQTKGIWVPIDPTWGNTSGGVNYFDQFDLNHIVFAINGRSSQRPFPAGSYKANNQETKDVEVTFGSKLNLANLDLNFELKPKKIFGFPIPGQTQLHITNNTGQAFYETKIDVRADKTDLTLSPGSTLEIETLLPFQTEVVPFQVWSSSQLELEKTTLTFTYDQKEKQITTSISPGIWRNLQNPVFLLGLGIGTTVIVLGTGSLLVFRRKR